MAKSRRERDTVGWDVGGSVGKMIGQITSDPLEYLTTNPYGKRNQKNRHAAVSKSNAKKKRKPKAKRITGGGRRKSTTTTATPKPGPHKRPRKGNTGQNRKSR